MYIKIALIKKFQQYFISLITIALSFEEAEREF